jgi:hypothetical protein
MRIAAISTAALLAAGGFIMVQAVSAEAGGVTRYVAPTGDDSENDCTVIANPCKTINHAVDEADTNDTVSIAPGRYDESVHIRKSLTLVGAGVSGGNKTTVDGNQDGGVSIWIDGSDSDSTPVVTVSHLDVSGNEDNDGIEVDFGSAIVKDSVVSNNDGDGIQAGPGSTVTVNDSTVSNNGGNGIVVNGQTEVDRPSDAHATVSASDTVARVADSDVSNNNLGGVEGLFADIIVDDSIVNANGNGGVVIGGDGTATINRSTLDGDRAVGSRRKRCWVPASPASSAAPCTSTSRRCTARPTTACSRSSPPSPSRTARSSGRRAWPAICSGSHRLLSRSAISRYRR